MAMARRWTPQRFVTLRRIRVIACIAATSIALAGSFAFTARKSVALNINGQTTQVTTYAMTATRLLEEQGVDIKTHDIVTTSSGDQLANHAVVTVQSAYQTTINIAASILDSKGIVLNKEDRVSVEKDSDETILRVRRVTHGEETRTSVIPFSTQTIIDPNLAEGQADVRQQGVNGEKTQVYDVTYVDGVAESETLKSETVTSMAIDQIIAVGAAKSDTDKGSDKKSDSADNGKADSGSNNQHESSNNNAGNTGGNNSGNTGNTGNTGNSGNTGNTGGGTNNNSGSSGSDSGTTTTPSGRLWHATVAQAQAYAAGAAAQRGWTGNDWDCLVKLWTRESSWLWYAENASSGAYGIPQSLPADKMAAFGANYRDDAAVQIDWGLWYIAQAYGSPSKAWQHSEQVGWY